MKTSSDTLWQLVRSLKRTEKTYLKRNFVFKKPNTKQLYLKLFDAIAKQKVYDESAIIKKFSPAITKKNIAFQKHYLQNIVGEAISQYDSRNSISHELYNQILLIRVLRKRGLIDGANALWKKTVTKARASEMYPILTMLITEFEKMILSGSSETQYEDLHSVFKGRTISYNEYAEMITLRDTYTEVLLLKRKSHFDIDDDLKERIIFLLEVVNKTNIKKHVRSFWFRHYYRLSKVTLLYLMNDIKNAMPLLKEATIDWENNTQFIKKDGEFYIELLYMINQVGILHGDYQFVINSFNNPINDYIDDPLQRANFEAIKYLALNKVYNKTAKYNDVKKLVQYMKTRYRHWESLLNPDLNRTVNFSLGIACFVLEDYNDALYFVKRGNTYFKDGTREEHSAVAHILLLLITFSMDNDRLFETEYRATYTYFYKRKKKHPFETALVQCLKRSFYLTDKQAKIKEYEKALKVFEENKDDAVQQIAFSIFNYPGWLISKVEGIDYTNYVMKKVKEKAVLT